MQRQIINFDRKVDSSSFSNAGLELRASPNDVEGSRAGLGFHNINRQGVFLYLDTDGRFKALNNSGKLYELMYKSDWQEFNEYINILPKIDVDIHFSVIFSYGRLRNLVIKFGNVLSKECIKLTTLPTEHCPVHEIYNTPIMGVPYGSGDNYLLGLSVKENGLVYITNYTDNMSQEGYVQIFYLA